MNTVMVSCARWLGLAVVIVGVAGPMQHVAAHDDGKEAENHARYEGPGYTRASGGVPAVDFDAQGVTLQAWLPLGEFDSHIGTTATRANDVWGYVSPTGREYAILGLSRGVGFVDVSNPTDPQIMAGFQGPNTVWRDIKTFGDYAYVVADDSQTNDAKDLQIFDLSQIDSGTVSLANTVTTGRTHNVAIDTHSGFLYRTGGADGDAKGLTIYDLNTDPTNPTPVGQWTDRYVHDAQAVTYTQGPFAGKQVVFAFAETNPGGGSAALDILDVTDKSDIQLLGRVSYSDNRYAHQGWLSPDRRYVYLDDELDERNDPDVLTTTTRIIDVQDLTDPFEVGTFTNGSSAIDHNLYTRANLIFEANYRSGLRVFDASDPEAPVEIAYFDTFPANDQPSFNSLWSNYPFFPSGTVLGSDIENGLFIWAVDALDSVVRPPGATLGDANNDGTVTVADFGQLQNNFGQPGGWSDGDFNGDGLVTFADFGILQNNFDGSADELNPLIPPASGVIPEPTITSLITLVLAFMLSNKTRRH